MKIENLLHRTDFFSDLSKKSISSVINSGYERNISTREILFHEGMSSESFFILLTTGSVRLYITSHDGKETTIKIVKPGEIFAEVIIFEKDTYPVSAVALMDSRVFVLDKINFLSLLDTREIRDEFIGSIMKKQRYLTRRIHALSAFDVEERFFRFLLEHYGKNYSYKIQMSKKDLASAIGTIPETLSRLILRLSKRGIISWDGDMVIIQDGFWEDGFYK